MSCRVYAFIQHQNFCQGAWTAPCRIFPWQASWPSQTWRRARLHVCSKGNRDRDPVLQLFRAFPSLSRCTEPFMMAWMRTAACSSSTHFRAASMQSMPILCTFYACCAAGCAQPCATGARRTGPAGDRRRLRAELHGIDLVAVALHLAAHGPDCAQ